MSEVVAVGGRPRQGDLGALDRRLFEQVFGAPARSAGVVLAPLGVTPIPDALVSVERLGSRWWISAEASADPCRVDGTHAVPAAVIDHVRQLHAAGVQADYLRVLHEVPDPTWSPGQPLPVLVPPARSHRAADTAILAGVRAALAGAAVVARGAGSAAVGLASVAVSVAVMPVALLGDPILLAGREIGDDRVLWSELARWTWT